MFENVNDTRWITLIIFVFMYIILTVVVVFVIFARGVLQPIEIATNGLVNQTLIVSLFLLIILVGGIILGLGKLRASDIGLIRNCLPSAIALTLVLWVLVQLVILIIDLFETGVVTIHPDLVEKNATELLGGLMGQIFGNALFEEIGHRGFLLPQLYLKLGSQWGDRPKIRIAMALTVSQSFFALIHIPIRLFLGFPVSLLLLELLRVFLLGLFYAFIYLRTKNLFIAIGIHSLGNKPTPLFTSSVDPSMFIVIFSLMLVLIWPLLFARASSRGL